jgi:hypothetical protein
MKTIRLAPLFAVLMMFGLTACPQTSVPRNFGGKPIALKPEEWQGTWRIAGDEDDLNFVVKSAATGSIAILMKDKKKKTEETVEIAIRETGTKEDGGRAFMLSMGGDEQWSLNLITLAEKGVFHSWNLQHDAVASAVKSGALKGEIKEVKDKPDEKPHSHTTLFADPSNYEALMDAKFWEWKDPTTFVRK